MKGVQIEGGGEGLNRESEEVGVGRALKVFLSKAVAVMLFAILVVARVHVYVSLFLACVYVCVPVCV